MAWSRKRTGIAVGVAALVAGAVAWWWVGTREEPQSEATIATYGGRLPGGDSGRDVTVVVRFEGESVRGVRVQAWDDRTGILGLPGMGRLLARKADLEAVTESRGVVRFLGVPSETLRVRASLDGFVPAVDSVRAGTANDRLVLELERGATLSGRVLHADGRGAGRATLRWSPTAGWGEASEGTADEIGRFELRGLPPGAPGRWLAQWNDGRRRWVSEGDAPSGTSGVELHLPAEPVRREVRLSVRGADGAAVETVAVERRDAGLSDLVPSLEIRKGVPWLPSAEDEWAIVSEPRDARGTGLPHAHQVVGPLSRLEGAVEVVLPLPVRLSGRVLDEAGAPLAGASVHVESLLPMGEGEVEVLGGDTETDADGRFTVDGVRPGPLAAWASLDDYEDVERRTRGRAPGTDLVVRLRRRSPRVEGTVTSPADPEPLGLIHWRREGAPEDRWETRAFAGGRFQVRDLRAGERIRVRAGLSSTRVEDAAASEVTATAGDTDVALVVPDGKPFVLRVDGGTEDAVVLLTVPGVMQPLMAALVHGAARFEDVDPGSRVDVSVVGLPDGRVAHGLAIPTASGEGRIRVVPGRTVTGRVVGLPTGMRTQHLSLIAPGWVWSAPVRLDGSFEVYGVPAVPVRAIAFTPFGADWWRGEARETLGTPIDLPMKRGPVDALRFASD